LLYFLGRRGFTRTAEQTIATAVAAEHQAALRAESAHFSSGASSAEETPAAVAGPPTGAPTGTGPQWTSLGPTTIPNGQTYGASRVNVSGRVAAIAIDPSRPAHVLCGAAGGGVWESTDRGASWAPRTDFAVSLAVGAIAFDPNKPATVYCGTGEGNFYSTLGAGVLRSSDGGTTWSTLCTSPFIGQGFFDLKVHPANSLHLLSGSTAGLHVSTDGGVTWTQRRNVITWSLSIAPTGGATAEILAASSDGVHQSGDGGTTWTGVTLPGAPSSFNRLAVAYAPSGGVAYAFGAGSPQIEVPGSTDPTDKMATPYLWRLSGGAWSAVSLAGLLTANAPIDTNQAWYDWFLASAPDLNTQVYLGAIDSYRGDLSGTTWTWTRLSDKGTTGDSIHPDQHAIAFEPGTPNTVYIGCDGGLFRSPDRGVTWVSCNNGLAITEFEYIAQNVGESQWLIGGTQDNGTERWTGDPAWTHVMDGDGGDCAVNRTDPAMVFAEYYGISPQISKSSGAWNTFGSLAPPVPKGEGSQFYCPFTCSSNGGNTIALGTAAVYVSRDNGTTWTRLTFPSAATASAIYVPDINDVYVGAGNGLLFHTSWNGTAWNSLTALTTPNTSAGVTRVFVDPGNLQRIWVTANANGTGKVYVSSNGGSSWTDRTAGLPNIPFNAIEVDSRNANRVWLGTDSGVYQSLDLGVTWTNFSNGLPNVLIGDLLFHPDAWVLRAGTRNRGVWQIPVDGWMTAPVCGVQFTGSLTANQTQRYFTFNWPATWHMIWTVMPTTVDTVNAQLTWTVQVQRASAEFVSYWITVQNLTAATVAFEGRYCILSRY
jgi:hypothetical protein